MSLFFAFLFSFSFIFNSASAKENNSSVAVVGGIQIGWNETSAVTDTSGMLQARFSYGSHFRGRFHSEFIMGSGYTDGFIGSTSPSRRKHLQGSVLTVGYNEWFEVSEGHWIGANFATTAFVPLQHVTGTASISNRIWSWNDRLYIDIGIGGGKGWSYGEATPLYNTNIAVGTCF